MHSRQLQSWDFHFCGMDNCIYALQAYAIDMTPRPYLLAQEQTLLRHRNLVSTACHFAILSTTRLFGPPGKPRPLRNPGLVDLYNEARGACLAELHFCLTGAAEYTAP